MNTLQEQLKSCIKEYTRQFSEIIGHRLVYWDINIDGFDNFEFDNFNSFSLAEICLVVDDLERFKRVNKDVGKAAREWHDYFSDIEHYSERHDYGRPTISLYQWLLGFKPPQTSK